MAEPLSREEREQFRSSSGGVYGVDGERWEATVQRAEALAYYRGVLDARKLHSMAVAVLREYLELGEGCTCSACSLARAYFVQADTEEAGDG